MRDSGATAQPKTNYRNQLQLYFLFISLLTASYFPATLQNILLLEYNLVYLLIQDRKDSIHIYIHPLCDPRSLQTTGFILEFATSMLSNLY